MKLIIIAALLLASSGSAVLTGESLKTHKPSPVIHSHHDVPQGCCKPLCPPAC